MSEARNLASEAREAETIRSYDLEADVVIVGLGIAGACAAIEAAAGGADVLVLERAGGGGGTSAQSGGVIYLGGGTPVQKACGFDDDPDEMFRFLMAASGPEPDEAKTRLFCDESVAHYHWFEQQGVPFKHSFFPEPSMAVYSKTSSRSSATRWASRVSATGTWAPTEAARSQPARPTTA